MYNHKRFLLLGLPNGYLTCIPAGDGRLKDRYKDHVVLTVVHRPLSMSLANIAKGWALRHFHV